MFLPFIILNTVSGFVVTMPFLLLLLFFWHKKGRLFSAVSVSHLVFSYLFCFLLVSVFSVTGIPSLLDFRPKIDVNFTLFSHIYTDTTQYVANVVLFIPFGFLLPLLWKRFESCYQTIAAGALFSFFIEMLQCFNARVTDIDDLIMNTIGTVLGFAFCLLLQKIFPRIKACQGNLSPRFALWELCLYLALTFFSMFFVQPFLFKFVSNLLA